MTREEKSGGSHDVTDMKRRTASWRGLRRERDADTFAG